MIETKVKALSSGQHFLREKKFHRSRTSNSEVNSPIWPEIELLWDFMQVWWRSDPDEVAIFRTTFSPLKVYQSRNQGTKRASNSKVNIPIWPEFELARDCMPVQIICKSHKDPIKNKKAMLRPRTNMAFFSTQRQVTPKWIVRSGRNSEPEFYGDLVYKFKKNCR